MSRVDALIYVLNKSKKPLSLTAARVKINGKNKSRILGNLLKFYADLIEVPISSKSGDKTLGTFISKHPDIFAKKTGFISLKKWQQEQEVDD